MEKIDFRSLTPTQEDTLQRILEICHYFQAAGTWVPAVSDEVFAKKAKEIGLLMRQI